MDKLIDDGVDGIITDYPDRLRDACSPSAGSALPRGVRLAVRHPGHRGGRAVRPENTLPAFAYALANPDISTLELDTGVTADGHLVVIHDRTVNGSHCVDTAPAPPGDPEFPYVGKRVHDLTLAPAQDARLRLEDAARVPGAGGRARARGSRRWTRCSRWCRRSGRRDVRLNIETKISPLVADTAPYRGLHPQAGAARSSGPGSSRRATIQSFDWRTILLARALDRRIETVALVWQYGPAECATLADECSLQAVYGDPSVKSPWTGGLDWWRLPRPRQAGPRRGRGARSRPTGRCTTRTRARSPRPTGTCGRTRPYFHGPAVPVLQDRAEGRAVHGQRRPTMQRVIDLGVDGIITDDPDLLIQVAIRNGLR